MPKHTIIAVLLLVAGCSQPAGGPESSSDKPYGFAAASNGGTYTVIFTPVPAAIPLNEMFTIDVRVNDAEASPVLDVQLDVDAAMPDHHHGMTTSPKVTARGGGNFTAEGMLMHMPGYWELYFDVTRNGLTERVQVPVDLE